MQKNLARFTTCSVHYISITWAYVCVHRLLHLRLHRWILHRHYCNLRRRVALFQSTSSRSGILLCSVYSVRYATDGKESSSSFSCKTIVQFGCALSHCSFINSGVIGTRTGYVMIKLNEYIRIYTFINIHTYIRTCKHVCIYMGVIDLSAHFPLYVYMYTCANADKHIYLYASELTTLQLMFSEKLLIHMHLFVLEKLWM